MATAKKSSTRLSKGSQEVSFGFANVAPLVAGDDPYSDTETVRQYTRLYQSGIQLNDQNQRRMSANQNDYNYGDGNVTDEDHTDHNANSLDEFGDSTMGSSKLVRTGRQRKKSAARSKGGEFQAKRKKRRVFFCCVSSEIDVHKLHDYFVGASGTMNGWKYQVTADVLHLYKGGSESFAVPVTSPRATNTPASGLNEDFELSASVSQPNPNGNTLNSLFKGNMAENMAIESQDLETFIGSNSFFRHPHKRRMSDESLPDISRRLEHSALQTVYDADMRGIAMPERNLGTMGGHVGDLTKESGLVDAKDEFYMRMNSAEVFVFEFGAVVYWGFPRGEELNILKTIRMFVTKGFVGPDEFNSGVDDMAFVTSPEVESITIANDVLTIPDDAPSKQRLAVSFAIAQSTVLAIFEARVYKLIEDYKYIPESLAAYGRIHLSERQLGKMIGDVFVIRHDVNLHTEILDTPDFFWKDGEKYEGDYKLVCGLCSLLSFII